MDDLLSEFLTEMSESLSIVDVQVVTFEHDPSDSEFLGTIFRLLHTIKGTCGFLGLPRLESVAHAGENVLGKFRDGDLEVTPEAVTLILKCIDVIRDLLGTLEESGSEGEGDDKEIINALNAMADGDSAPAVEAAAPVPETLPPGPTTNPFGAPVAAEETQQEEAQEAAPKPAPAPEPEPEKAKVPAVSAGKTLAKDEKEVRPPKGAAQTIRVNVELLENLMTLVSEMVLTRNQLMQMVRDQDDSEFTTPLQRLSLITTDLQEGVMKTRMQPIGNAWAKLPRIVRDLSVEAGKKIDLQMRGAETELDRQVLELIKDPLTHMVRYSADHGLELLEDRMAAGKPETGKIDLNAFHEGGHIIIQIADAGRGLDIEMIKDKIIQNELATEAEVEAMSEQQIQQFIFKAGFSTAEKVTSVSGRGVGMDVVRTSIENIGGTIEVNSVTGEGSTFTIKIPLTMAIVSALIIESANQRFAIPRISVVELVRASSYSEHTIEMINESPVLRLRNRLLPLVSLRGLLKLGDGDASLMARGNGGTPTVAKASLLEDAPLLGDADIKLVQESFSKLESATGAAGREAESAAATADQKDELFIVVTRVGTYTFGIIVDRVFDTEEIVVKPVDPSSGTFPSIRATPFSATEASS